MRLPILFLLSALSGLASAVEDIPREVRDLQVQRETKVRDLDRIYRAELEKLKVKFTKEGNLVAANKVAALLAEPQEGGGAGSNSAGDSADLEKALAGTPWIYHYDDALYEITFGKGGSIKDFPSWKDVKWRAVSPNEVILTWSGRGKIVLSFDKTRKSFECHDWSGSASKGTVK